jgi:hypothetical protein
MDGTESRPPGHTRTPFRTRDEALRDIEAFIAELEAGWQRDRLDWAPELILLLREFRSASQVEQLATLRTRLHEFFFIRKRQLKGISFLLRWVDDVIESYE